MRTLISGLHDIGAPVSSLRGCADERFKKAGVSSKPTSFRCEGVAAAVVVRRAAEGVNGIAGGEGLTRLLLGAFASSSSF